MQQKNLTHVNILIQVLDLKVLFSFKKKILLSLLIIAMKEANHLPWSLKCNGDHRLSSSTWPWKG